MKKDYEKPTAELVSLLIDEEIAEGSLLSDMGTGEYPGESGF